MPLRRKTTSQFVEDAQKVHGDRFDYSEVEYVNTHKPVRIKCRQCGVVFMQEPASHLAGHGCPNCGKQQLKRRMSQEAFIEKCRAVHGNQYDYNRTEYRDLRSKVLIVCPRHGEFWERAQSHILGNGCPKCKREKHIERITELQRQLALAAESGQGNKY